MAAFVRGDVVVIDFPFSDLSKTKRRPAIVVGSSYGSDILLCSVTSQSSGDPHILALENSDFSAGTIKRSSTIRYSKLLTVDEANVLYKAGALKQQKIKDILQAIIQYFETEL